MLRTIKEIIKKYIGDVNVEKLQNRFQFLIVVAMFMATLLDVFFRLNNSPSSYNQTILNWGNVIAILIIDFVFIEAINKKITSIYIYIIYIFLHLNLLIFTSVFMLMSAYPINYPVYVGYIVRGLLISLDVIPFIILGLIIFNPCFSKSRNGDRSRF